MRKSVKNELKSEIIKEFLEDIANIDEQKVKNFLKIKNINNSNKIKKNKIESIKVKNKNSNNNRNPKNKNPNLLSSTLPSSVITRNHVYKKKLVKHNSTKTVQIY